MNCKENLSVQGYMPTFDLVQSGNGASTSLWLNNWHPLGPLYKRYGENVCSNIGRSLHARVSAIICDGTWSWPRQRNRYIQEIKNNTPPDFLPDISNEDSVVLIPSRNGNYSLKSAWDAISVKWNPRMVQNCLVSQSCP